MPAFGRSVAEAIRFGRAPTRSGAPPVAIDEQHFPPVGADARDRERRSVAARSAAPLKPRVHETAAAARHGLSAARVRKSAFGREITAVRIALIADDHLSEYRTAAGLITGERPSPLQLGCAHGRRPRRPFRSRERER